MAGPEKVLEDHAGRIVAWLAGGGVAMAATSLGLPRLETACLILLVAAGDVLWRVWWSGRSA